MRSVSAWCWLPWALAALALSALRFPVAADPTQLGDGVLILHNPVQQDFSIEPPEGWCQNYRDRFAITSCEQQVNRIDSFPYDGCGKTWFVLAAWDEPKEFVAVEFGFAPYPAGEWEILEWGPCFPGEGIEQRTPAWPGPNQGVRLGATSLPWTGNLVPVYWFCGVGYYIEDPHLLPLGPNPASGFAGFTNTLDPPQSWDAACLGAIGWRTDGVLCCPPNTQGIEEEDSGPKPATPPSTWSMIKAIYRSDP